MPIATENKTIRCNHCMSTFYEEYIDVDATGTDSGETCPVCMKGDALMDIEPTEQNAPGKLSLALMDYFQDPSNISPKEADALRTIQARLMQDSEKKALAIRQQFRKGA